MIKMYTPIKFKNKKYGNNRWDTFSKKLGRDVHLYSDLEYEHWILIEFDPNVLTFCEQPLKIKYFLDNKLIESIFDMWVKYLNGDEFFIEVKYLKELNPNYEKSDRAIRQTKIQKLWCEENNKNYKVVTENEIRKNPVLLSNANTIVSFIKNSPKPIETDYYHVLKEIQKHESILLSELEKNINLSIHRVREAVYWLIYNKEISSNIDLLPIGYKTELISNA